MLRKLSLIAAMAAALAFPSAALAHGHGGSWWRSWWRSLGGHGGGHWGGHGGGHWGVTRRPLGRSWPLASRRLGRLWRWRLWWRRLCGGVAAVGGERTWSASTAKKPALARASMCLLCTLAGCEIDAGDEFVDVDELVRRVGFWRSVGAIVIDPRVWIVNRPRLCKNVIVVEFRVRQRPKNSSKSRFNALTVLI